MPLKLFPVAPFGPWNTWCAGCVAVAVLTELEWNLAPKPTFVTFPREELMSSDPPELTHDSRFDLFDPELMKLL